MLSSFTSLTMLPSISCFYVHRNYLPTNFTFIRFEKFVKVILNSRAVIMTFEQLAGNFKLFKIYKLSLLLTTDTSQIASSADVAVNGKLMYGVITQQYWKSIRLSSYDELTLLEKAPFRNPLNASEPKRESSGKKLNKFQKLFDRIETEGLFKAPDVILAEFIEMEAGDALRYFRRHIRKIEHEKKITMLSGILHKYGRDVYHCVNKFL